MYERSLKLMENAWALHGLACLYLQDENKTLAEICIQRGMQLQRDSLSYQKEGFKILSKCEAYSEILDQYERLNDAMKEVGRIQYYHILGLVKTGYLKEADALLNSKEGIVVDDIREGEDNLQDLWKILNDELYEGKRTLPYRYEFHAN